MGATRLLPALFREHHKCGLEIVYMSVSLLAPACVFACSHASLVRRTYILRCWKEHAGERGTTHELEGELEY
jgi:hypothetical protein